MYKRIYGIVLLLIICLAAIILIRPLSLTAENAKQTAQTATQTAQSISQAATQAAQSTAQATQAATQTAKSTAQATQAATQPTAAPSASKAVSGSAAPAAKVSTSSKSLSQIFKDKGINPTKAEISIFVDKSDHVLSILANGSVMKSYHVELGDSGLGDKKISGDHKTPEGTFYISQKSVLNPPDEYLGTRWMRLSYPGIEDAQRGLKQGLIGQSTYNRIVEAIEDLAVPPQNTALGGGVGIHGGSTTALGKDWTWGCVGLTNKDVEDFYSYVKVGTKVVIRL